MTTTLFESRSHAQHSFGHSYPGWALDIQSREGAGNGVSVLPELRFGLERHDRRLQFFDHGAVPGIYRRFKRIVRTQLASTI
jgi:hypothetical protein